MERNDEQHITQRLLSIKDEVTNEVTNEDEYNSIEITSIRPPRNRQRQTNQRRYLWLGLVTIVIIIALASIPIRIINYRQNPPTIENAGNLLWTSSNTGILDNTPHWDASSTQFSFSANFFATAQMYNLKTKKLIQYPTISTLTAPSLQTYSSPNGNYLITINYSQNHSQKYYFSIWDTVTGKLLFRYTYRTKQAAVVEGDNNPPAIWWSTDSTQMATLDNDLLYVLSTHSGSITVDNTLYLPITSESPVIWSADSHYMIIVGDDLNSPTPNGTSSVAVWDVSGTKQIMTTRIFQATNETAIVSPDRRYLATLETDGNTVDVWEISSGRKVATHHGIMKNSNYLLAWSPDGKYLAGTFQNNEVRIWNALTNKDIMLINKVPSVKNNSSASIQTIQWSPDNSYIAISATNDQDLQATYKYALAIWNTPQH